MILYHGSNMEVREPRLLPNQRDLDFGKGFYTTSNQEQAARWAGRTVRVRRDGEPCVSVYRVEESEFSRLNVLRFSSPDYAWLEYVAANRRGMAEQDDYDMVIGPVANDQTFPTILLYLDGYINADAAIQQLLPQKLSDQYTFKSEKAIALLQCTEVIRV